MWSPVFIVLLVASVRAEADADPEPALPLAYPHYFPSWAAQQFGTPEEVESAAALFASQRGDGYAGILGAGYGFLPPRAPPSPLFAIRDVRAPTAAIEALRKPAAHVLRHPSYVVYPPPVVFHPIHIRVPGQKDAIPIPVAAPPSLSFASQHTAQLPYITRHGSDSSLFNLIPIPLAAPHYPLVSQPAQDPDGATATPEDEEEDAEPNYIWLPRFPTELPGLMSLRGVDDEPVIPAGIVQATQPTFTKVVFRNDKAHPSLLNKMPIMDGPVISV